MYDEPFADSSQIPTYLVSKLARTQVTVALSGDGGDELFGGYNRHLWVPRIWRILSLLPVGLRKQVARLLSRVSLEPLSRMVGRRVAYPQDKLNKLTQLLPLESPAQFYKSLASAWSNPNSVVIGGIEPQTRIDTETLGRDIAQSIMRLDELTYLHDDILVKVDRASMAVSLEARAPLLDPNVAFLSHRLPLDQKIHGGVSKWALRQALYKRLPRELFERPKAGFTIPVGNWLRGDLRPWAEELLAQIPSQGYLRADPIQERWQQHLQKRRDWTGSLWAILMFQAWLNEH
jgi:asparagine synthase (glutamine-hydrolysing)